MTIGEVRTFRSELYAHLNRAFTQQVHFGEISTPPSDPFAGSWIRLGAEANSAELVLTPLPDAYEGMPRYFVTGFAIYGGDRPRGPNIGVLEFVGSMTDEFQMTYRRAILDEHPASTIMNFAEEGTLVVSEEGFSGEYGHNVNFVGIYRRSIA